MANPENLKPIRSVSEAREKGKIGGIKSGEARRERKTLKEELLFLLSQDNVQEKISLAIIQNALKGDIKAFTIIRDTIGEKPIDKQEIQTPDSYATTIYITEEDCHNPENIIKLLKQAEKQKIKFITAKEQIEVNKHIAQVCG